ncbi:hypothetical protein EVAR_13173_1 [Eumeta japonica]|uniref:Uncharacterized protein n=1 Tax=Eumeta variegata TaxID=151549 RepID=A0A4C1U9V4_EUMVA|nr:hypothetical protein EVAR_13173_1 [Eumeta japonica]
MVQAGGKNTPPALQQAITVTVFPFSVDVIVATALLLFLATSAPGRFLAGDQFQLYDSAISDLPRAAYPRGGAENPDTFPSLHFISVRPSRARAPPRLSRRSFGVSERSVQLRR